MNKRQRKKLDKLGSCIVCGRPARCTFPDDLCTHHWKAWSNGSERVDDAITRICGPEMGALVQTLVEV